jgi:uncharacterized protein YigE (DUF2233 family)
MRCCSVLFLSGCFFFLSPGTVFSAPRQEEPPSPIVWRSLRNGLDLAEIPLTLHKEDASGMRTPDTGESFASSSPVVVTALRIDPEQYTFTLHMASHGESGSLPELAKKHDLVAAVNASMYLPDRLTSTGYLRNAAHVNNPRVVGKFGAFFVAHPLYAGLPRVALLDRMEDDWRKALDCYALIVQNYRLNNVQGKVLWNAGGPPHSFVALSRDQEGRVLFLLCRDPVQPGIFAGAFLRLPLGLRTIMYLEGGSQAMLLVRAGNVDQVWTGRMGGAFLNAPGNPHAVLPNVIGVRARAADE